MGSWENTPVCLLITACRGLRQLVCKGFIACPGSFPSCREENDPDSKSGWDLNPDKPECSTSCWEDVTDPSFSRAFFVVFVPDSTTFATDPRVIESITGSFPVEHPHYPFPHLCVNVTALLVSFYVLYCSLPSLSFCEITDFTTSVLIGSD